MTPEEWQRVRPILESALELDSASRPAFLDEACADPSVRREVESLIAVHEQAGTGLLASTAVPNFVTQEEARVRVLPGTHFGVYEIREEIGHGGMGEVYRAHDSKLDRDVAIKTLPGEFASDPERLARLRREARTLASLNHPNIGAIYDLEEAEGVSCLVLELVEGETIHGPLPLQKALEYSRQVSEALEAAHNKGIIHRDLKPANVKVTPEGRVKVLDFGLAKAVWGEEDNQRLSQLTTVATLGTVAGQIMGTPAYMSPEQARGEKIDKRTDIWAFGCLLFELLTGKLAFKGESLPETIVATVGREPDWSALPPKTPAKIRELLRRCLQKDPQRRLQDFGRVRNEIEQTLATITSLRSRLFQRAAVGIAATVLLISFAAAGWFYRLSLRDRSIDSLAVLPFVNASADPNMEYLSDGITESLINGLSQLPNLKVMSRDSAFRFKGKDVDAKTAGLALGVRAVFRGRVTERGDMLDISAELVDTRDDSHIWGQQYDRKFTDIFALREEIAKAMTTALRLRLNGEDEKRLAKGYTVSPEAYQDYLKGRYWVNKRTPDAMKRAIEYFQQAISKDPAYAQAYTGVADSYDLLAANGAMSPTEAYPRAEEAALQALKMDSDLAEAHTSLGYVKMFYEWDRSGGEREFQRAIALNPGYANAHFFYGSALRDMGRREESIAELRRTLELDPLSLPANGYLGVAFYQARQYDDAINQLRKTLEMDPNFAQAHYYLGMALLQKSLFQEGIAEFQKTKAIIPGFAYSLSGLGYAYAVANRRPEALEMLDQLTEMSKRKYVFAAAKAQIYVGLEEKDKALEWLEKAYQQRSIGSAEAIKVDPIWDPLRSAPRFADLLRRTNLQP